MATRKRAAVAALAIAALGTTGAFLTPVATAAPDQITPAWDQSAHPAANSLWASSESNKPEQVNGSVAAIVDDDSQASGAGVTFWNSNWREATSREYPHALKFSGEASVEYCGMIFTSRPTYGSTYGNLNTPSSYKLFNFDTAPDLAQEWGTAAWSKEKMASAQFHPDELIATGGLETSNDPQQITFTKKVTGGDFLFVGLEPSQQGKNAMAASDIKLTPCASTPPSPAPSVTPQEGNGVTGLLHDLYLQTEPFVKANGPASADTTLSDEPVLFTQDEHTYWANAYYFTDSIIVHPEPVAGATVTINGSAPGQHGESVINLQPGWNVVEVAVTKDGQSATYYINVYKHASDYRGRTVVPDVTAIAQQVLEGEAAALVDSDPATTIKVDATKRSNQWEEAGGIELTLPGDDPHWVSKITAQLSFDGTCDWNAGAKLDIWGSTDGQNFDVLLANNATLRSETNPGFVYWDFNRTAGIKKVRIFTNAGGKTEGNACSTYILFKDVQVWESDKAETLPPAPPQEEDTRKQMFDANKAAEEWGVTRAQALAIKHGIVLPAWIPSEYYGRGAMDAREQEQSGGIIPMFYDSPLFDRNLMARIPNSQWALAKAPKGANSMGSHPNPSDFRSEEMKPYTKNLVDIQYGDEGGYSRDEVALYKKWFDWSKEYFPGAIVHNNINLNPGWTNSANMHHYVTQAQPDLLSWDTYYYSYPDGNGTGTMSPENGIIKPMSSGTWSTVREHALKGVSGEGTDPLMWGQYLDYAFRANMSPSRKALLNSLSLAGGAKWFGLFRMEYAAYDYSFINTRDGAPTRAFYEYSRVFRETRNLGEVLKGMNNTYLATYPGDYGSGRNATYKGFRAGNGTSCEGQAMARKYGLIGVSATSDEFGLNEGRPGDVVVGYFDKVPGLKDAKATEIFGDGITNPKGFLVVNGLAGNDNFPQNLAPRYGNGELWQTHQAITVSVQEPKDGQVLKTVDPTTGEVSDQPLQKLSDGTTGFTVDLDGGAAKLYYWSAPNEIAEPSEECEESTEFGVPYHPESVEVDSEQNNAAEVATKDALIDKGNGEFEAELGTFWHSQWSPSNEPLPHSILAPRLRSDGKADRVCGVMLSPRANKQVDFPKTVSVFGFDEKPSTLRPTAADKSWAGGTLLAETTTAVRNNFTIGFDPTEASHIGLAIWDTHAGNAYTSISDFQLIACPRSEPTEPEPSETPTETGQPEPSETPTETGQPEPSETPTETGQPEPSETPTETGQPEPSETPTETGQPEPSETSTETGDTTVPPGEETTSPTGHTESASTPSEPTTQQPSKIPVTGANTALSILSALIFLSAGTVLVWWGRRRQAE